MDAEAKTELGAEAQPERPRAVIQLQTLHPPGSRESRAAAQALARQLLTGRARKSG